MTKSLDFQAKASKGLPIVKTISGFDYQAKIDLENASLASLHYQGIEIVKEFARDRGREYFAGQVLAPWPNRIKNGTYSVGSKSFHLEINDRETNSALHGFAYESLWAMTRESSSDVYLEAELFPKDGYPFSLKLELAYSITSTGLKTTLRVINVGEDIAPYGAGFHPYFSAGATNCIDNLELAFLSNFHLENDESTLTPRGVAISDDTKFSFNKKQTISSTKINHSFKVSSGFNQQIQISNPEGRIFEVKLIEGIEWIHIYTLDFASMDVARTAIAIEPMTCPGDSFNNGYNLILLKPLESHVISFEIAMSD